MLRKLIIAAAIFLLFDIVLVAAIMFSLPTDAIRHLIEKNIEKALKYEQGIEIKDISISPLLNVTATGFQMTPRVHEEVPENLATAGGEFNGYFCEPYIEEQTVMIDEVFVNPSIIKILRKKPEGKFELKIQSGSIKGELRSVEKTFELNTKGQSIQLDTFTPLSNATNAQIYGELNFEMRAVLDANSQKKGINMVQELQAQLNATATAMCPKRIKLNISSMPFIEMPFTVFGDIEAIIELQKDKLTIEQLTSTGPDIQLNVSGDITLKSDKNPSPRLNLTATILPSESWINDNNMNAIYKICEKHDDGSIKLKLNGTTKRLKHDCGTPIPEPESDVDTGKSSDNPDDSNAKPDKDANSDNKEDTADKDAKTNQKGKTPPEEIAPGEENNDKKDDQSPNDKVKKDNPTMEKPSSRSAGIRERSGDRPTRSGRSPDMRELEAGEFAKERPRFMAPPSNNPAVSRLTERLDAEIMREMENNPRERERRNFDRRTREREVKEMNNIE